MFQFPFSLVIFKEGKPKSIMVLRVLENLEKSGNFFLVRKNLENLEKSGNFILVRENLENLELSGNFVDIAPKFFLITLLSNCLIMSKFLQHTFQYHMGPFRSLTGGSWVHIVINIVLFR